MNRQEQIEKLEKRLQELKTAENRKKRKERTREMCVFAGNIEKSFRKVFGQSLWGQPDRKDQIAFMENTLLKLFESYKQENEELPALVVDKPKPEKKKAPEPPKEEPKDDLLSFELDDEEEEEDISILLGKLDTEKPDSF